MIGLAISSLPLNKSLCIHNLQFTSAPGHIHQERNFTTLSTPFYQARQARHFLKHTKETIFMKHAKFTEHTSTPSMLACQPRKTRKARRLGDSFKRRTHLSSLMSLVFRQ